MDSPKFWNPTFVFPLYLVLLGNFENVPSYGILIWERHLSRSGFLLGLLFFLIVPGLHPEPLIFWSVFFVSYNLSIKIYPCFGQICSTT